MGVKNDPKPYRVSGRGGIEQFSKPKASIEENGPCSDWPPSTRSPGGEGGSFEIPNIGGAEILKPQEAIPPFSLMEDSIHGKNLDILVYIA